jgi:hypothetical protein
MRLSASPNARKLGVVVKDVGEELEQLDEECAYEVHNNVVMDDVDDVVDDDEDTLPEIMSGDDVVQQGALVVTFVVRIKAYQDTSESTPDKTYELPIATNFKLSRLNE